MINLTIVASVPDDELPRVVYVTGSQAKLDQMNEYALVRDLRKREPGCLIDRRIRTYRKTDRIREVGRGLDQLRFCGNLRTGGAIWQTAVT